MPVLHYDIDTDNGFEIGDTVIINGDVVDYDGMEAEVVALNGPFVTLDLDVGWDDSEKLVVLTSQIELADEDADDDEEDECEESGEPMFYLLWNPDSPRPPTYRFGSRDEAEACAHSMATRYGGTFYICLAVGYQKRHEFVLATELG